jgi:hypothetical protein
MVTGFPAMSRTRWRGSVPGLRIKGERRVEIEVEEPHQAGAALCLVDQRAELLIGRARGEVAEQALDVGAAHTRVDAVHDI